jgi:hypothetical protein
MSIVTSSHQFIIPKDDTRCFLVAFHKGKERVGSMHQKFSNEFINKHDARVPLCKDSSGQLALVMNMFNPSKCYLSEIIGGKGRMIMEFNREYASRSFTHTKARRLWLELQEMGFEPTS